MNTPADASGAWSPFELPGALSRRVKAHANGATYRVSIWLPPGTPPSAGFPVVVVLDANALFPTFVDAVRRSSRRADATGIVPTAVVGIAHDGDELFADALRRRDYTAGPASDSRNAADATGGAAAFLSFIADELLPGLRKAMPLDSVRQMLFGHSLAGHFVLEALAARPAAFSHWAAISPSIWWDEAGVRQRLATALGAGAAARVFLAAGEWEGELPPWQRALPGADLVKERRAQRRMVENARALALELSAWLGDAQAQFRTYPEEDHASVVMIAAQRALRFAGT